MIYTQLFHAFMIHFLAPIFLLPISINLKDHAPLKKDLISTTISCVYDPLSGSKCMLSILIHIQDYAIPKKVIEVQPYSNHLVSKEILINGSSLGIVDSKS